MRVVDEAIENGVGIGWVADHVVPLVDGDLAGDDGGAPAVAFFENLEEIMACGGVERFETPVIQDEELHTPKRPQEPRIAAIAARQCEVGEELGNALIQNRAVVATGFVAER